MGICGGAPKASAKQADELLLGDVVVSTGVVQYDLGRRFPGRFVRKDTPHDNLDAASKSQTWNSASGQNDRPVLLFTLGSSPRGIQ